MLLNAQAQYFSSRFVRLKAYDHKPDCRGFFLFFIVDRDVIFAAKDLTHLLVLLGHDYYCVTPINSKLLADNINYPAFDNICRKRRLLERSISVTL